MAKSQESLEDKLIKENKKLSKKISKLEAFLSSEEKYKDIDIHHVCLMVDQLQVMNTYSSILQQRINLILDQSKE